MKTLSDRKKKKEEVLYILKDTVDVLDSCCVRKHSCVCLRGSFILCWQWLHIMENIQVLISGYEEQL